MMKRVILGIVVCLSAIFYSCSEVEPVGSADIIHYVEFVYDGKVLEILGHLQTSVA